MTKKATVVASVVLFIFSFDGRFQPRMQRLREMGDVTRKFTNVFVKNFGEELSDDKLKEMFGKFGEITSVAVMRDVDSKKAKGSKRHERV